MDPTIISPTIQIFLGVRYYLCGKYFQKDGQRLHRAVWSAAHGPVADGNDVHHVNDNRSDNRLANLESWGRGVHRAMHGHQSALLAPGNIYKAIAVAPAWHRSEVGLAWHRAHGDRLVGRTRQRASAVCIQCSVVFEASDIGTARYCSRACCAKRRRESGIDKVARLCPACGGSFLVSRFSNQKSCSRRCSESVKRRARSEV